MELNVLSYGLMIFPVPSLYQRAFLLPGEESSSWAWMSCLCVNPNGWSLYSCNQLAAGSCWVTSHVALVDIMQPARSNSVARQPITTQSPVHSRETQSLIALQKGYT